LFFFNNLRFRPISPTKPVFPTNSVVYSHYITQRIRRNKGKKKKKSRIRAIQGRTG